MGRLIARWNPGEVFAATPAERADVETEIARSVQKITPRGARATYHCRVGRELLRGRNWKAAWGEYARAATFSPLRLEAYKGIVAATLHVGAAKTELPRQAALI